VEEASVNAICQSPNCFHFIDHHVPADLYVHAAALQYTYGCMPTTIFLGRDDQPAEPSTDRQLAGLALSLLCL
jgi:hypothetical protein